MTLLRIMKRMVLVVLFVVLAPLVVSARELIPGGQNVGMEIRTNV